MKSRKIINILTTALTGVLLTIAGPAIHAAEAEPAGYEAVEDLSGSLSSVGSDTLVYVMSHWVVNFKRLYPKVSFRIEAAGSSTAPPALIDGSANFGPMSRLMKDKEIQAFVDKFGHEPTVFRVALDGLAVFVHKDNPIEGLTVAQLDAIYSATRQCGHAEDINSWGQLGLTDAWTDKALKAYGRNSLSGTNAFFAQHALCKGSYKDAVIERDTSGDIVRAIANNANGIGYSGIGYKTSDVRILPLTKAAGQPYVAPSETNIYYNTYPLRRYLYLYVNKAPNEPLPPLEREFIKMVLSAGGQELVTRDGFIPLSPAIVQAELTKLN